MILALPGAEPRLQRRYHHLVMAQLSPAQRLAAGFHPPPSVTRPFAAVQAAWRFYSNPRLTLVQLAGPLIECARADASQACKDWMLVVMDWSHLHYGDHDSKTDRVELAHANDLGYDLLTALAVGDRDGSPIAPLTLEMRAGDGMHSTRTSSPFAPTSPLDDLGPVMDHIEPMKLGHTPVFIIDREADSVGHYRKWSAAGHSFLVRADDIRLVLHQDQEQKLGQVADRLRGRRRTFSRTRTVTFQGRSATQFVAETEVVLHRPARTHRVDRHTGQAKHHNIAGPPLPLRLIVSEIRGPRNKVLARWLLLTNLPEWVTAAMIALWYYWRWRIESYHKLLKGAGQQIESWQQETAAALARRLLVAAMAAVVVWRLARDPSPQAAEMRDLLVRLSGRQMKRGKNARPFTEPALLAGLGVLMPMLDCLRHYNIRHLRHLAETTLPEIINPPHPRRSRADDG